MSKPKKDSSIKIPTALLEELLTPSEIRMLRNRWRIINLVKRGVSIRKIASQIKVGTDTVVRTIRMAEKNKLLSKTREDLQGNIKSQTPWIFGKADK